MQRQAGPPIKRVADADMYFSTGESPKRRGNVNPSISPCETFAASDGWFNIGVANDKV